jgi:N-acetylglucosamine kinase-like BadF-type ATPase
MTILVTGNTSLARKIIDLVPASRAGSIQDCEDSDHVVVITQGKSRGVARRIIDVCFTDIVTQIEDIGRDDIRFIVIGSMASEYSSWPGISKERMLYANAKKALSKYVSDFNQMRMDTASKSVGENRIQICEPAAFKTEMSNYSGLDVETVAETVKYLIDHPEVVRIQLRQ